ncbi:MAG: SdrD B-like domain-containing protein [Planctomycetota bacterium]|jgi:hypothetical protein
MMAYSAGEPAWAAGLKGGRPGPVIEPLEVRLLLDGGQVSGRVWDDLNANGVHDPGEPGLDGWTVELVSVTTWQVTATTASESIDLDGDGAVDPASESGLYSFTDVPPGRYHVRSSPKGDWNQTAPRVDYAETLTETNTLFAPRELTFDFTGTLPPEGDGTLEVTATGDLAGPDKYLQLALDGTDLGPVFVQAGEHYTERTQTLAILHDTLSAAASDGTVSLTVTPSGAVADLAAAEEITVELSFTSFGRYPLEVVDGAVLSDRDFGFYGPGTVRGTVWEDLDADGTRDAGEPGVNGWTVRLFDVESGDLVATWVTADDDLDEDGTIDPQSERGLYAFEVVGGGPFEVRVTSRPGWRLTDPADGRRTVAPTSGQQVDGVDFGVHLFGPIHGRYWRDTDGDGVRDGDEPGLDGRNVELLNFATGQVVAVATTGSVDLDGDGTIDPNAESGMYAFPNVAPGDYRLQAPLAQGWSQTAPATEYLSTLTARM